MITQSDFKWQDYASCNGIQNTNIFYDDYESDVITALNTDQICMHCPVARQCLKDGEKTGSWGVWGGVYLVYGKIDQSKNSHKSEDDWNTLERIHGRDFSSEHS